MFTGIRLVRILSRFEEGVIRDVDVQLRKLALDYDSGQIETTDSAATAAQVSASNSNVIIIHLCNCPSY